ncbi:MAG: DUF1178 family protein [Rhodobacteraceae bacterium]|nr:DUF1178 family protein [Paracoccaceae bacterium]
MIQYSLKCAEGHTFDSWFQSAEAFDKLAAAGMVSCAVCGGTKVEKAIMAPRVRPARSATGVKDDAQPTTEAPTAPALSTQNAELEQALTEMRRQVEQNSDYVGEDFASEARAMHLGDAPERSIYGEAKPDEAKALIEDGIPVAPLPFMPNRKTN